MFSAEIDNLPDKLNLSKTNTHCIVTNNHVQRFRRTLIYPNTSGLPVVWIIEKFWFQVLAQSTVYGSPRKCARTFPNFDAASKIQKRADF